MTTRRRPAETIQKVSQGLAGAGMLMEVASDFMGGAGPIEYMMSKGDGNGPIGLGILPSVRRRLRGER